MKNQIKIANAINAVEITFLNPSVNYYNFESSEKTTLCFVSNHFALDDLQDEFEELKNGKAQILLLNNLIAPKFKLTAQQKSKWAIILIAPIDKKNSSILQINQEKINDGKVYEFESNELYCEYLNDTPIYIKLIALCSESYTTNRVKT